MFFLKVLYTFYWVVNAFDNLRTTYFHFICVFKFSFLQIRWWVSSVWEQVWKLVWNGNFPPSFTSYLVQNSFGYVCFCLYGHSRHFLWEQIRILQWIFSEKYVVFLLKSFGTELLRQVAVIVSSSKKLVSHLTALVTVEHRYSFIVASCSISLTSIPWSL